MSQSTSPHVVCVSAVGESRAGGTYCCGEQDGSGGGSGTCGGGGDSGSSGRLHSGSASEREGQRAAELQRVTQERDAALDCLENALVRCLLAWPSERVLISNTREEVQVLCKVRKYNCSPS